MAMTDRRSFIQAAAALPMTAAAGTAFAQAPSVPPAAQAKPAAPKDVTRELAHYLVTANFDDLPANVRREGVRTMLNWVGVAIGGSHHQTVDIAASALAPFSGPAQASLLGRKERFDIMNAAFLNGVSSHIFDYDDTHLKTIIHPGRPQWHFRGHPCVEELHQFQRYDRGQARLGQCDQHQTRLQGNHRGPRPTL